MCMHTFFINFKKFIKKIQHQSTSSFFSCHLNGKKQKNDDVENNFFCHLNCKKQKISKNLKKIMI